MFKFMWTRRTRLFGGHEISFYRWQHCNKRQSEDARSSQRVGKSSRDTSAASHHLARQGHIPGGNYVRRVSDRVSEFGSENVSCSLFFRQWPYVWPSLRECFSKSHFVLSGSQPR